MKGFSLIAALPFLMAASTEEAPAPKRITETDLIAAASEQATKKPHDVFSNLTPIKLIAGRAFRVSLPLFQAGIGVGLAGDGMAGSWDYDPTSHALKLSAREQSWPVVSLMVQDQAPHGINGFYARYAFGGGRNYTASNAFGATATISAYHARGIGLAYPRQAWNDDGGMPPPRDVLGFVYEADIPMDGAMARRVARGIHLVAEGHVTTFATGENVVCGKVDGEPTMASRIDLSTRFCLVAAKFERVSFQTSDGTVLKEWTLSVVK